MSRDVSRLPFTRRLKVLGFVRKYSDCDPLFYFKTTDHREVRVQLWKDGNHRAAHTLLCPTNHHRKVASTLPTDFETVQAMELAIERETTRQDHPQRPSWESENQSEAQQP